MDKTGKQLLNLMFRPGERICVSHNKYGYHSLLLEDVLTKDDVTLLPTPESCEKRKLPWPETVEVVPSNKLTLVALNPIKSGFREDANVTAYRNFLVEMDIGPLNQQLDYIKRLGLPYSAVIFSGNKSLHFLISLSEDLPNEDMYRLFAEWTLSIVSLADQKTKNPSRSIRIPGGIRDGDKVQKLVEYVGPVNLKTLVDWLQKRPDAKPKKPEKREPKGGLDGYNVRPWARWRLIKGLDPTKGRSNQWYAIALEFFLAGAPFDDTIEMLRSYYTPDRDFKEREWKMVIKSAWKRAQSGR